MKELKYLTKKQRELKNQILSTSKLAGRKNLIKIYKRNSIKITNLEIEMFNYLAK